jgi:hypothetical protein
MEQRKELEDKCCFFELDENHACVLINYQHDRFRINCSDKVIMTFWARYWFIREFPNAAEQQASRFRASFNLFLEANKDKIEDIAKYVKGTRQEQLSELLFEIKRAMQAADEGTKKRAIVKSI